MGDRTDIDALLIGALYGELAPADEARLAAHLESHPADRAALADLTSTRAQVRASRLFAVQLEPPQSVSALLLQEAARRTPKARPERPEREEREGWFYRFTHMFMAHPAMAAATMLVLVVGVASILYTRKGVLLETAQPSAPAVMPSPPAAAAPSGAGETTTLAQAPAGEPPPPPAADLARGDSKNAGSAAIAERIGAFRAGLAEERAKSEEPAALAVTSDDSAGVFAKDVRRQPAAPAPAKASKKQAINIKVDRPDLKPMDIDDRELAKRDTGAASAGAGKAADKGRALDGLASTTENQQAAPPPAAPPPPPSESRAQAAKPGARTVMALEPTAGAPAPAPAQPAPRNEADRRKSKAASDEKLAEEKAEKPSDDRSQLAWAQKKHDQVVALVKSNNCRAAAKLAMEIYSTAPDYYARNVATDRAVKPCSPYLNDLEERNRAAKRALQNDAPAASPPVRK